MKQSASQAFCRVLPKRTHSFACLLQRHPIPLTASPSCISRASSSSRWKQRQGKDSFARDAKVQGLKSRAAFKLLEMDSKYRLFKPGQMIVDLGYAPGSWSQVAMDRSRPNGKVVGIDLIPAQPPKGVSTFQGDFLSPMVQKLVKNFIIQSLNKKTVASEAGSSSRPHHLEPSDEQLTRPSYIELGRQSPAPSDVEAEQTGLVDVILSDMLMNTSGVGFRDHVGSMDLCAAALSFASDTLKVGGHFVCKFYQGSEDKNLEQKLKAMFAKVYREKPESSRSESREAYFIALRRKSNKDHNS